MTEIYKTWVEQNPGKVADLAYSLAIRREYLPHRAFAIVNNGAIESISPPADLKSLATKPNVVVVLTGQGTQRPQMGWESLQSNETFRASIGALEDSTNN